MDMDMDMDMGANVPCWRAAIIQRESSTHLLAACADYVVSRRMRWLLSKIAVCADRHRCDLDAGASIKAALAQRDDSANVQISGMA